MRRRRSRRLQPYNLAGTRPSRRTRLSLALVFATVFAPGVSRPAAAECVPFSSPPAISTSAAGAFSVFAADLDRDGDLDVLAATSNDDQVAWHENGGDGDGWTLHTISGTATGAEGVHAADVDGDGDLDALSAAYYGDAVAWHENDGSGGGWTLHTISSLSVGPTFVVAADLDGDGDLDALSAFYSEAKLAWHENDGDGLGWTLHTIALTLPSVLSVLAADVDGDGDLDAITAAYDDDLVAWYENDGSGEGWTPHTISSLSVGPTFVVPADLDGDGDLDALSSFSSGGSVAWHENDGDGQGWTLHTIASGVHNPQLIVAADLDGDGDLDALAATTDPVTVWYENDGAGGGWTVHTFATTALPLRSVHAADLDGDGDIDPLSASFLGNKIAWYRNQRVHGEALFAEPSLIADLGGSTIVASVGTVDVDGDGDLDLLVDAYDSNDLSWHENTVGDGSAWSVHPIATAVTGPYVSAVGDVDRDGDLDVLTAAKLDGALVWHENVVGDGSSWSLHTAATGFASPTFVAVADIDRDGDLDAALASSGDDTIAWLANPGSVGSAWTSHVVATSADRPYSVRVADLDGDGDPDLVSASLTDSELAWYENLDGAGGTWATHEISTAATGAIAADVADLDGDGDLDIGLAAFTADAVFWFENVAGNASAWSLHTLASAFDNARGIELADLDRDGDVDVVASAKLADELLWLENVAGDGSAWSAHSVGTVDGALVVIASDVDGDGDLDVATASYFDNRISWVENLGTKVFAAGFDSETDASANLGCWSTSVP